MGDPSLAESVTALRDDFRQLQTAVASMREDQAKLQQMFHQFLAAKGPAEATSSHANANGDDATHSQPPPPPYQPSPPLHASIVPRFTKLEFPRYDGRDDPTGWLHHCEQFFKAQNTPQNELVSTAAFHLTGVAQMWHYRLELEEPDLSWPQFKQRCFLRFGPGLRSNALGSLAKLNQGGRHIEEFNDEFQASLLRTTTVRRDQEVDLYTAGLDEWLRIDVENQHPANLDVAMNLARSFSRRNDCAPRVYADSFASRPPAHPSYFSAAGSTRSTAATPSFSAMKQGYQSPPNSSSGVSVAHGRQGTTPLQGTGSTRSAAASNVPLERRLSRAEYQHRRSKGLCYNCDERWTPAHICKRLFLLVIDETVASTVEDVSPVSEDSDSPGISLHAITGTGSGSTMRVKIQIGETPVTALIDSGSTHNFVDTATATRLGLCVRDCPSLQVAVANGERIQGSGLCENVTLCKDGQQFRVTLYVIPLSGFELVLGIKWLRTLGAILWDFNALTMSFSYNAHRVTWQGEQVPSSDGLHKLQSQVNVTSALDLILTDFSDLFQEPTSLPPRRSCDHRITLIQNADPVAVRPYRYPQAQKDEIEKQCTSMLKLGVIRPSRSPYSSPVLLVLKHDRTWRFCIDYRELNDKTVKDKFPIPVIDELLDELHGARFFTKLDLRSGYHQIRMHAADVEKTAFRTHHGHFEFLVMPFGLCNAPSTFQALMNDVFGNLLRKFVLVFFDDILIYSRSWVEHLHHVRTIFSLLRKNNLLLKQSKCSFGESRVCYLGHIITVDGVSMDNSKVQAVLDWPRPQTIKSLRGFLGLAGFYRKFIQGFGLIAAPLTSLLRKNNFVWTDEATTAFDKLKIALTSAPVLQLPDFTMMFVVECDASGVGIGAVLHQNNHPIAFFSRKLAARHHKLASYEQELIGLSQAIRHWRHYLWGRKFVVRTDHYSLKFLLQQRLTTSPQHHWVSKLLGYDFEVEFRAGRLNTVADALSRRDDEDPIENRKKIYQLALYQAAIHAKFL